MISKDEASKVNKRRVKRTFTAAEKRRFYDLWKNSGLTKARFCQGQDLVFSAFAKWCKDLEKNPTGSKNDWSPIVAKEEMLEPKNLGNIEIKGLNTIKICIFLLLMTRCLRVFFDAITSIR